jgi:hypothetical protein
MFDLEEINLMPSKVAPKKSLEGDARARAKAIEMGARWKCSRTKVWVNQEDCIGMYYTDKAQKLTNSPCLECSVVVTMIKKLGADAMARPAKKGTPDPIVEEVKIATEPKLEIVTKPVPEVKEKAATFTNPFDGWQPYDPHSTRNANLKSYATFSSNTISFSSAATEGFGMRDCKSANLYLKGKSLGVMLIQDNSGKMRVTGDTPGRRGGVKISAAGVIKHLGGVEALKGKRFSIKEHRPGFIEINVEEELAA